MRLTCNIYTKAVCALTLLLVLLATGCRNEREDLPTGKRGRQLTLTASMPQDGGGMRVELKKSADNSTLIAKWKSGDMVTFVFEQGDVLTDPVEAAIGRIENNGKRAKLHIEVPESIDTSEEYTIHAFCGVPGTGVSVERGEILLDILPLRANRLEDIAVPVIAKRDISPEGEEEMALPFDYLGSIEYVDLKNGSSTTLRVNNCHLYAVDPAAEEWRYLPRNGKYHLYKPMTDEVMEADGDKPNPLEESGSAISVAPGATHTFAVWHRPTGNSIPEFGISVQTDNGTQLSKNKKIAKAFSMTPGKAYRVRAEWKDNRLTILGDDVEEDLPSITLTTEKKVGEKIELEINAEPEDQADVWIDLNNNKVKDAGESVTVFGSDQKYTLGAQTVTVYGKVTALVCSFQYLTSLDVIKNPALTALTCYANRLTSLDVSKNTALKELECDSNSLTSLDVSKNTALEQLSCSSNSLTSLDVSKNKALTTLSCTHNSLTSLDVSKNTALTIFACYNNPNLSSLKISSSINDALWVNDCKLSAKTLNEIFTTLPDVKGQSTGDKELYISNNPGTDTCNKKIATDKGWTLDVEDTPPAGNSMTMTTEKKVGEKIELRMNAEPADRPDIWIDLNNNKVKDAGESVTEFGINKGYTLAAQTVTVYGKVSYLNCYGQKITSLDVSKNTALTGLVCYSNSLTSLDVSKNKALTSLDCEKNKNLSSVKISSSINNYLDCNDCKLSAETLNEIFTTLPDVKEQTEGKKELYIKGNPGTAACNKKIAEDKGWKLDVDDTPPSVPNQMTMTTEKKVGEKIELRMNAEPADQADVWIDLNNNKVKDAGESVTEFGINKGYTLAAQTVTVYGKVSYLNCYGQNITSLDVSKNKALTSLDCEKNKNLSSVKISNSINNYLDCNDCKLSAETLNEIFTTLPDVKGQTEGKKELYIKGNPGTAACNKKIAEDKGWRLDVDDTPPSVPNQMTMTTTRAVGDKIQLYIDAEPADRPNVWIDLNNNKVKDAGESVTEFGSDKEYTLGYSQTVTVYGKVTELSCYSNSLTSLDVSKNIALKVLDCSYNYNSLTSLDVSKNAALRGLYCSYNSLTSLNVSKNTALTSLDCSSNSLTSLDVSKNTALTVLNCYSNSLTSLDVSKNKALKILTCGSNKFTSLDVSKNTALTRFSCEKNPNLSSLKISSSINDALRVNGCKLSAETLNEIFTTLPDVKGLTEGEKKIWIANNPGTAACNKKIAKDKGWKLDVGDTPPPPAGNSMTMTTTRAVGKKIMLKIYANPADRPNVWIDLNNNKVKDAGESVTVFGSYQEYTLGAQTVTVYGKVTGFDCEENSLTSLDVSKNKALVRMFCTDNSLTSLDVSKNTALVVLGCASNSLTSLDVSKNIALKVLSCGSNSLTSLDVSKNTALTQFFCSKNPNLSSLKISSSINDELWINHCKLSAETLNEIFRTLPDVKGLTEGERKIAAIKGNPGTAACNKKIATDKGWELDVEDTPPPAGNSMTMTTTKAVGEKIKLRIYAKPADHPNIWIDLNNNKVKDAGESVTVFGSSQEYKLGSRTITVYGKVTGLSCGSTSLTSLDVSKNTKLEWLYCDENSLTSLDVSKNTALTELSCYSNSLASLDVSKNTALEHLSCSSNSLTSLDVSKNTALTHLYCNSNSLTSLDVSKNTALEHLSCSNNLNLSSLKISRSINDELSVFRCKLSAETLNEIFRTLPDVKGQTSGDKIIWINYNPGTDACNKKIAEDKGWTVY